MKAIQTRYLPATNFKGSRVTATAEGGDKPWRVTVSYDGDHDEAHKRAAEALCAKMGWTGDLIGGGLPNGDMAWVFVPGSWKVDRDTQAARLKARGIEV